MQVLQNTGKKFLIILTGGGEPLLVPNIIEFCNKITEDHYLSINTNLTSPKVTHIAASIDPKRVENITASTHIEELFKTKLIDRFINNFNLLKDKGFNVLSVSIAYPAKIEKAIFFKEFFAQAGIYLDFNPFWGVFNNKNYPNSYTEDEIEIFNLSKDRIKTHKSKNILCNAGYNMAVADSNGYILTCHQIKLSLGNINKSIKFNNFLIKCPFENCSCPLYIIDHKLLNYALQHNPKIIQKS